MKVDPCKEAARSVSSQIMLLVALVCASQLVVPSVAHANAGVPMLFVTLPQMLVALLPVVILESYVLQRFVTGVAPRSIFLAVGVANLISTVVGVPLVWAALAGIQIATGGAEVVGGSPFLEAFLSVTWQAPWLLPVETSLHWMIPTASLVLLVPFFFASVLCERLALRLMLKGCERQAVYRGVWRANLWSYAILALITALWLIGALLLAE